MKWKNAWRTESNQVKELPWPTTLFTFSFDFMLFRIPFVIIRPKPVPP